MHGQFFRKEPLCSALTTRTLPRIRRLTLLSLACTTASFPNLPSREVKGLRYRLHFGEFNWEVCFGEFLWTLASSSLGAARTHEAHTQVRNRSARLRPPSGLGRRAERTSVTYRTLPLGEGAAPAPERLSSSRKRRVYPKSAAGSGCPEAEAIAELIRWPPTAMSAFDTNPFADPVDVNPFQVESLTHSSL